MILHSFQYPCTHTNLRVLFLCDLILPNGDDIYLSTNRFSLKNSSIERIIATLLFILIIIFFYFFRKKIKQNGNSGDIAHSFRSIAHSQKRENTGWNYCTSGVRYSPESSQFSLGISQQIQSISIVNRTIQDGIRQGWVWEAGVPIRDRHLRDNDGSRFTKAIIEHFQQILSRRQLNRITHPIIEDQHISSG